jgi:hypothetical protein
MRDKQNVDQLIIREGVPVTKETQMKTQKSGLLVLGAATDKEPQSVDPAMIRRSTLRQ